jgi:hypothetical protein
VHELPAEKVRLVQYKMCLVLAVIVTLHGFLKYTDL